MANTTSTSTKPAAATKPTLSESQRTGAIERAAEAAAAAGRVAKTTSSSHQHSALIGLAAKQAQRFADDAVVASGVADAQYASRKAIEAAAAAAWLYGQRV